MRTIFAFNDFRHRENGRRENERAACKAGAMKEKKRGLPTPGPSIGEIPDSLSFKEFWRMQNSMGPGSVPFSVAHERIQYWYEIMSRPLV